MSQSDKIAQEMGREVEHIAAAVAELGDNLQDKPALVALIEKVDSLNKMAVAHGANPLSCLASWWDKILTATLLDQIADSPAVPGLMSDMLERAALIVRNTSEGGEEEPSRVNGLAERAAELLGLSAEIAAFSKGEASDPGGPASGLGGPAAEIGEGPEASGRETSAAASGPMDEPAAGQSEAAEQEGDLAPEMLDFSGTMFDDSLIYDFIDECESHLDDIEPKILTLEENMNDLALVDEIFRPVHSIKGGSGFLQIHAVTNFSHEAENLLDAVRKKRLPVTPYLCETLLGVMDVLKTMLSQLRTMADRALGSDKSAGLLPPVPVKRTLAAIHANLEGKEPVEGAPGVSPDKSKLGELLIAEGALSDDQLENALEVQNRPLGKILVQEGYVEEGKVERAVQKQQAAGKRIREAIKVDIEKLDEMVNLVGELVIAQTLVRGRNLSGENGTGKDSSFEKDIGQLGKITKEIQDRIMSLRMVPLQPVFQKMTRVVRDVARKRNKKVRLVLSGEDIEVDKTVSELIGDPLVHIIRNSVDHGVESPAVRRRWGKEETGEVQLSAYHEGGSIIISISDDGMGLNRERILKKAVERGLVEAGASLSDAQVYQIIMQPGFSTAEVITDISGRGVGLDVVTKNIEKINGKVEVSSSEGKGSTFIIKLPLTLAIIDGMVVRVGRESYILPTLSIVHSFRPKREQLSTVAGRGELVNNRGTLMPLVRLHRLYDTPPASPDPTEGLTVIVESDGRMFALLVDDLIGQQQIVIKSLGPYFAKVKGLAGATILGDGRVSLILDIGGVFKAYRDPAYYPDEMIAAGAAPAPPAPGGRRERQLTEESK